MLVLLRASPGRCFGFECGKAGMERERSDDETLHAIYREFIFAYADLVAYESVYRFS